MRGLTSLWQPGRLRSQKGSAAIELAVAGLVYVALIVGAVELSRAVWMRNTLQYAAADAARWALVRPTATTDEIVQFAQTRLVGLTGAAQVSTSLETVSGRVYRVVTVTQSYEPVTSLALKNSIALTGRARILLRTS